MKIGLLGATLETNNLGLGALAAGAIRCLLREYPNAEIVLVDYAKTSSTQTIDLGEKRLAIKLLNLRFSKRFYLGNNIALLLFVAAILKIIPSTRMRTWLLSRNRYLEELAGMDLVVSLAGGDSFSDIYGFERLVYVSLPQILSLLLKKKLVLLPQSIGPFRNPLSRTVARYIVRRAERVYSRDRQGVKALNCLMASDNSERFAFSPDLGFLLDPIPPPHLRITGLDIHTVRISKPLIGLNISGLLFMGGYNRNNMFDLRLDYPKLTRDLIELLIKGSRAAVLLIPHVFGTQDSESDQQISEKLFEELQTFYPRDLGIICGRYNQNEVKSVIGQCDFFIGSRMHACIGAVSQSIPTLCVAYSDKFIGVMETVGIPSIVADARKLTADEILKLVGHCFTNRAAVREELQRNMPNVISAAIRLFSDTRECQDIYSTPCVSRGV